jgi:hypothetical protein
VNDTRWLVTISLMAAGCGATDEQLHARAAVDLDCRPEAISSQYLDSSTRIANGCGKQAVYVETCSDKDRLICTWMLNSAIRPSAAVAK